MDVIARLVSPDHFPGVKFYEILTEVLIGRDVDVPLRIPDPKISRRHARIVKTGDAYVLEDLRSSNGTLLNGLPVTRAGLKDGDVITLGKYDFTFQILDSKTKTRIRTKMVAGDVDTEITFEHTMDVSVVQLVEQGLKGDDALDRDSWEKPRKRLETLHNVSEAIAHILDVDELLDRIMDQMFAIFSNAERGFIMLIDPGSGDLLPKVVRNRSGKDEEDEIRVSQTLVRKVMEEQQAIISSDAMGDERFDNLKSIVDFSIRSLMCAPLLCAGEVLGIIHMDATEKTKPFERDDLMLLIGIATQAAGAIKNAQLVEEKEKETEIRTQFQRYFSPQVVNAMMTGKVQMELGGRLTTGTVLFSDIVGFTAMSENRDPREVVALLNRYFCFINEAVFEHSGMINKFGGDAILALWGVLPEDPRHPLHAVQAAIQMQNALFRFNVDLPQAIGMGIGINTGSFLAGHVGSDTQFEFTVIGDAVNLSQRVESLATRGQVLISQTTRDMIKDAVAAVRFPLLKVKGKTDPIAILSIRGIQSSEFDNLLTTTLPVEVHPDGRPPASGLVTSGSLGRMGMTMEMQTTLKMPPDAPVRLRMKLPEIDVPAFQATLSGQDEIGPGFFHSYLFTRDIPDTLARLMRCQAIEGKPLEDQVRA